MKRLLLLAYYFPPTGGAGTQRALSFARHLPALGWETTVVTGPSSSGDRWTPTDTTLLSGLGAGTEIIRVPGPVPPPSSGWRSRSERWLRRDPPFARWWIEAAVHAGRQAGGVDAILATMSPYESARAASLVARALGVPWVADLRDPWALDEVLAYPSRLHRGLELRRMCRLLGTAAAVVMNTPEAARAVRGLQEIRDVVVTAIPNGFEPSDFGGAAAERTDDAFRIVHTGYLHTELGSSHRAVATIRRLLGGTLGSVDLLTRSHVYLLEAVRSIRERDPELGRRIEVHLAGVTSEADRAAANLSGIRLHDYLSHDRAVALMRGADLLFLPMHDLPPTVRSRIVPGKTYEYLASGRPILAAVPDGDARDLVASGTGHWLCRPADVEAIAAAIAEQARLAAVGAPDPGPPPGFDRYSREALTSRLADLLERVTAAGAAARSVALPRTIGPA